jgi:maleylpyruvate isomerase
VLVSDESFDPNQIAAQVAAEVESCVASHASLSAWLRESPPLDPSQPSGLPDWSLGHVLSHIARNADGHLGMLDGLPQYSHGLEGRNRDIESGATRGWAELVDDVVATSAALDARFAAHDDWSGNSTLLFGERPTRLLPMLRQREVEVHRADLGLGYGFADMPSDYLRRDLRLMGMLWQARQPMGLTTLPQPALAADPPTRLAWMMGRAEIDGLDPAGLF